MPFHESLYPAYLDVDLQQWTGRQMFLTDTVIIGDGRSGDAALSVAGVTEGAGDSAIVAKKLVAGIGNNLSCTTTTGDSLLVGYYDSTEVVIAVLTAAGGTLYLSPAGLTNVATHIQKWADASGSFNMVGNGADPPAADQMGKVAKTAQAAAIGATNLTNATPAGRYRVSFYASTTTANVTDGTLTFQINYTDRVGATSQVTTTTLTLAATSTGTTALKGSMELYLASGNVTYRTNLTGSQTTARYSLDARCEFLG